MNLYERSHYFFRYMKQNFSESDLLCFPPSSIINSAWLVWTWQLRVATNSQRPFRRLPRPFPPPEMFLYISFLFMYRCILLKHTTILTQDRGRWTVTFSLVKSTNRMRGCDKQTKCLPLSLSPAVRRGCRGERRASISLGKNTDIDIF